MVLKLKLNIRPGWRTGQSIVTNTVYCSRCRIDTDSRFQASLKYRLTLYVLHMLWCSPDRFTAPARFHQALWFRYRERPGPDLTKCVPVGQFCHVHFSFEAADPVVQLPAAVSPP